MYTGTLLSKEGKPLLAITLNIIPLCTCVCREKIGKVGLFGLLESHNHIPMQGGGVHLLGSHLEKALNLQRKQPNTVIKIFHSSVDKI